jgi:hypothetical protein
MRENEGQPAVVTNDRQAGRTNTLGFGKLDLAIERLHRPRLRSRRAPLTTLRTPMLVHRAALSSAPPEPPPRPPESAAPAPSSARDQIAPSPQTASSRDQTSGLSPLVQQRLHQPRHQLFRRLPYPILAPPSRKTLGHPATLAQGYDNPPSCPLEVFQETDHPACRVLHPIGASPRNSSCDALQPPPTIRASRFSVGSNPI